ncbi:hypothetical protein [Flavobacterium ajazii]|uniref:hypothetical protein n=1 Tax=Flavobacterium ajazii TaxID=2692318 RepID=UPI0013D1F190|nr:hypothetical protein [Flavobacterium ajazii]
MTKKIFALAFLAVSVLTTSCDNDDDKSLNTDPTPAISVLTVGTWRITKFEDSGVNKTADFAGYNFTFSNGNVLAVNGNDQTYSGSWSVTSDDEHDTPPDTDLDLNLYFANPQSFRVLNEDWDIISISDTKVEVADIDDDGPSDYLVFERN